MRGVNLEIMPGEVVGIIGSNGSGKSTLLQLVCGILAPTTGSISVRGRVTALLELGAGFNPEFTGRENVFLSAAVSGLSQAQIVTRFEEIVEFSGIRDFIDQPVKTYSSGMYVRLAFSVATSVDPDILVIDEALSVGDGAFARKSFDRIMQLKAKGTTILFCSHSLYQVEAFCDRALWLDKGNLRLVDTAARVTVAYQAALDSELGGDAVNASAEIMPSRMGGRILNAYGAVDGVIGTSLRIMSLKSTLSITVEFFIDPKLHTPSVALGFDTVSGMGVTSVCSAEDHVTLQMDESGRGQATIVFPALALLKGEYFVSVFLGCERALHLYDMSKHCLNLQVSQQGLGQGVVALPHVWQQ
ncbi:MAG: ABC transporter ATP-binding protein [Deltaproteobacteria bacterium]|nr:ABC transporter ATP-binding protein [Deltaproteobacteria bacterium]